MPAPYALTFAELHKKAEKVLNRFRTAPKDSAAREDLLADLDRLLIEHESLLAPTLAASIAGGYFDGANAGFSSLPPTLARLLASSSDEPPPPPNFGPGLGSPDDEPPEVQLVALREAAERMARRRVMDSGDFYRLENGAKDTAFTITADLTDQSRRKIHELIVTALDRGPSYTEFRAHIMEEFGKLPVAESHLEQVFRNATNESFSQGQDHVLNNPMVADEFPYRLYAPIADARARPEHIALGRLGLDGTAVYHKDDPTWLRFRPPWAWGCRCGQVPLSIKDAARRGVREAEEWLATGIEPEHRWVTPPTFAPDPRWDRLAVGV